MKYPGKSSERSANREVVSLNSLPDTRAKREQTRSRSSGCARESRGQKERESKLAVTINLLRLRLGN